MTPSCKAILTEIDNSLHRLGTDYVAIYKIRRWDSHSPIQAECDMLAPCQDQGIRVIPWSP